MIKKTLIFAALSIFPTASAYSQPTPRSFFEAFAAKLMAKNPAINEFEVCIESDCETFSQNDVPRRVTAGMPADPSQASTGTAEAVGQIIGEAAKAVGVGGRIVVDYEKKADGSIKVRVEASFGTGSGAASGASSNPDNPFSK